MRRILVVYYSRTGYTRTLAGNIAAAVRADVEALDDGRDRRGWDIDRRVYDQHLQGFVDVIAGGSAGDALSIAAAQHRATA
jgi:flavodoxin